MRFFPASADNTYQDDDNSGLYIYIYKKKPESNNYLITTCLTHYLTNKVCFWLCTKKMPLANHELYIALGNYAGCVVLVFTMNCRFLANKKTDSTV